MPSKLRSHLTYANVVATLALFVALGGGTYAATSLVGDDGTIKGCVKKKGKAKGSVRIVAPGKRCRRSERTVVWNQDGEPGPQGGRGPTGRQGIQGKQGLQGPPGQPGSDAQFNGAVAGGDLTGAYPDPAIKDDAVNGQKVADASLSGNDLLPDSVFGTQIHEGTLGQVPSAANAAQLGGLSPGSFMRSPTKWKSLSTIGQRFPVEIGNPACSGDRECTASLVCDPGDVLLSGGFDSIDSGTRVFGAFPFNANGNDQRYLLHWENNSTADTVQLKIICADQ